MLFQSRGARKAERIGKTQAILNVRNISHIICNSVSQQKVGSKKNAAANHPLETPVKLREGLAERTLLIKVYVSTSNHDVLQKLNRLWYSHTIEYYSVIKINELPGHEKTEEA